MKNKEVQSYFLAAAGLTVVGFMTFGLKPSVDVIHQSPEKMVTKGIEIEAYDFGFRIKQEGKPLKQENTMPVINIPENKKVSLMFHNKGAVLHDFVIKNIKADVLQKNSEADNIHSSHEKEKDSLHISAASGKSAKIDFIPQKSGTYLFSCTIPGHKEAGMVGKFVVGKEKIKSSTVKSVIKPAHEVPPLLRRTEPQIVEVSLHAKEIVGKINEENDAYEYWTFDETVPGPMVRVMQGDTVKVTVNNAKNNKFSHSIDLHAAEGDMGGGTITQTKPGEKTIYEFKPTKPGLYLYHCATPPVYDHIANGMYGMILVEPPGGLPSVDKEFYLVQGELYTKESEKGHKVFDYEKAQKETPDYYILNGGVKALTGKNALHVDVGDTIRVYFGAGAMKPTNTHVIGEIFDRVYPNGGVTAYPDIQTISAPAGGTTMLEFTVNKPGDYPLVDHNLTRSITLKGGAIAMFTTKQGEHNGHSGH